MNDNDDDYDSQHFTPKAKTRQLLQLLLTIKTNKKLIGLQQTLFLGYVLDKHQKRLK